MTEDEMVGWHYGFSRHEFEQTLGDGEGQGSLACCSPWGLKESWLSDRTTTTLKKVVFLMFGVLSDTCRRTESLSPKIQ